MKDVSVARSIERPRGARAGRLASACGLALLALAAAVPPASAVHDARRFEVDGNPANSSSSGDDWSLLNPTDRSSTNITRVFVRDPEGPDTSYFTGGGSKDPNRIQDWRWTSGDVAPDKNEITDAYAVAYRATRDTGRNNIGDLLVFFGLDRFGNDGDAQVGYWFFRNPVGLAAGGRFSGSHTVGDVLVITEFTQGGRLASMRVYKWVGSGGSDGTLDLVMTGRDCSAAGADDAMCTRVNASNTTSPWAYTPKDGSANVFPPNSFFEGGVNITRIVPGLRCLKGFMAETRSSSSISAQLKDFAMGPFDTCPVAARAPSPTPTPKARVRPAASGGTLVATGAAGPFVLGLSGALTMLIGVGVLRRSRRAR